MSSASTRGWLSGAGLSAALLLASGSAGAQTMPPPPDATATAGGDTATNAGLAPGSADAASATTASTGSGCPYSARWSGHGCCCHHGNGMRIGMTATSALVIGAAIALNVLAVNRGNEVTQLYDARDPNHSMPLSSYADLAAMNGQRQTMQDWSIGLYVTGGIFTAMSALMWLAPLRWRAHARQYQPQVAVSPNHVGLSFTF